jgi:hypothetical protein
MSIPNQVSPIRATRSIPTVQLATKISPESKSKLEEISHAENVTIRQFIETAIERRWVELKLGERSA